MNPESIYLAFVWHQHQPYYQDLSNGKMLMPWVRLHALKDYYDMAAKLKDYPAIRQTFNLVPSLLKQLKAYEAGEATDEYQRLSAKAPADMLEEERRWVLTRLFDANRWQMIDPHPRYKELAELREGLQLDEALRIFQNQDLLDLQVWFNLVWVDPLFIEEDEFLKGLIQKGKGFTAEEKTRLLEKQAALLARVIPVHRELAQSGQIELTTTPFYHPILPLLCDSEIARECMPNTPLPRPFRRPEDALKQLRKGLDYFESIFGFRPKGMWPSEGSVSPEALDLVAQCAIQWAATDEEILARSLGQAIDRDAQGRMRNPLTLYQPYLLETPSGNLSMVFRDHFLSDLIGFHYSRASAQDAASDFVHRILAAGKSWPKSAGRPPLISVILDGENCWETYPRDGHDFLDALYSKLSDSKEIACVTVGEYLQAFPATQKLKTIFPGSWINHNYRIWIGHSEDNRAWNLLNDARDMLGRASESGVVAPEDLEKAWEELYIAEGSDWFWWYGDDHTSGQDELFDQLYRRHLMNVYRFVGQEIPAGLREPIGGIEAALTIQAPTAFITPVLDGRVTHFYEWQGAGFFNPRQRGGAMHQTSGFVEEVYFGFDLDHFYFRTRLHPSLDQLLESGHRLELHLSGPARFLVRIEEPDRYDLFEWKDDRWRFVEKRDTLKSDRIVEGAVPWAALGAKPGEKWGFFLQVLKQKVVLESCPEQKNIPIDVPDPDFEAKLWLI